MRMYLINVKENTAGEVQAETLQDYYKHIECTCVDIVQRKIGRKRYEIICDDEGLFEESPKISAINNMGEPMLVGNLLIAGLADGEGNLTPLTEEDVKYIEKYVITMCTRNFPQGYMMLTQCEF